MTTKQTITLKNSSPPNGGIYEGETLNGKGKMTHPNGTVKEGEWKDGEFVDTKEKELSMDEYWQRIRHEVCP
jgi:hypothetical protein